MRLSGCGAQRGHHVFHAVLRQRHNVHVALNHEHAIDLADRGLRLEQAVQFTAFAENRRLGRVQIFRPAAIVLAAQNAATKPNHSALLVEDRKHHAFTETVVAFAAVTRSDKARRFEQGVIRVIVERFGQRLPSGRGPTEMKATRHFAAHTALLEVFNGDGRSF